MTQHFSPEQLAQQYSPSSCVNDINIYLNEYAEKSNTAKEYAKNKKLVLTNLRYSTNKDTTLDLYLPETESHKNTKNKRLQIYIHGGYWQALSKDDSSFAATNFQAHGCYFAALNYSLAPNVTLTDIVEQIRLAIAWLYQHAEQYGYSKDAIYLSGSSAGAHLAIMMLNTNWCRYINNISTMGSLSLVKGICAVSGIYDLTPIAQTYINEPLQLSENEILQNSPLLLPIEKESIKKQKPCPIIISYGENETTEFKRQSQALKTKLSELNYPIDFKEIADRNHFNVIVDLADRKSWLFNQVLKQMELSAQ
mgnify:CR=1 FL=1